MKAIFFAILFLLFQVLLIAQKTETVEQVFWGNYLVDMPTTFIPDKGTATIEIFHRFGKVENGIEDFLGIYAPTNISMGIDYSLTNRFALHFAAEKKMRTLEFASKWKILSQNISNTVPVSVVLYNNISVNCGKKEQFGINYNFTDRLFYLHQLIISRQFQYKFNLSGSFSFIHYNKTVKANTSDKAGFNLSAGYKFQPSKSLFVSFNYPVNLYFFGSNTGTYNKPEPNLAFGVDISSHAHQYQIFMTSQEYINEANASNYNNTKISFKSLRFGFNIIVKIKNKK